MKAIKITTNNVISVIDIQEPTLKGMQAHVGGIIEIVRPYGLNELNVPGKESLIMIVNEEGRCIGLPLNKTGSHLYNDSPYVGFEPIVGDILFMAEGFVDGEPDIIALEDDQIEALLVELKNKFIFLKAVMCKTCKYSVDYGESVEYIRCEHGKKKDVKKIDSCNKYEEEK